MLMKRKNKVEAEIPSASMADIAFLLLVFFLTTTVFNEEKGLELLLPESKAQEIQVSQKNMLHIIVMPDGRITLKKGKNPEEQPIPVDGLAERMRQEISLNPKIIAAVKTDPDATYDHMVQVLDELQEAEASRISLQILNR
ncbi:MAG: biopolymer transporter ExbD [Candidatus Glassbacteria bacterium]|nr:biopolymer transporter ExbD [Candidatus Glassbacteria bacterium]